MWRTTWQALSISPCAMAPSIIFIDEIDAIGRARGRGGGMGEAWRKPNRLTTIPTFNHQAYPHPKP
jgi:hypothetical protein